MRMEGYGSPYGAKPVVAYIDEHVDVIGYQMKTCSLPLTGQIVYPINYRCFDLPEGMVLVETLGDVSVEEVKEKTEAQFSVKLDLAAKN